MNIASIRTWIYAYHWRTWIGHAVFAAFITAIGGTTDAIFGTNTLHTMGWIARGYYVIDTLDDLVEHPGRDPWYDHVMDTVSPWVSSFLVEVFFRLVG